MMQHGPRRKRLLQQFFSCCVCIHCHRNVYTETFPKNYKGMYIQTHKGKYANKYVIGKSYVNIFSSMS
jgi:hypothetical protein